MIPNEDRKTQTLKRVSAFDTSKTQTFKMFKYSHKYRVTHSYMQKVDDKYHYKDKWTPMLGIIQPKPPGLEQPKAQPRHPEEIRIAEARAGYKAFQRWREVYFDETNHSKKRQYTDCMNFFMVWQAK